MTSLRMAMSFKGTPYEKIDPNLLFNMGWNYGFHFDVNNVDGHPIVLSWPTTYPQESLEHAAGLMGYELTAYTSKSLAQAKAKLKELLAAGEKPIVHWAPHLVVAESWDEASGNVWIHDPQDVSLPPEAQAAYNRLGLGRGRVCESPDKWTDQVRNWQAMGFPIYTIKRKAGAPPFDPAKLDFKAIYQRLADRTLGTKGQGGNVPIGTGKQQGGVEAFGVEGIRAFAKVLPAHAKALMKAPMPFEMKMQILSPNLEWGHLGFTARYNAQKFLKERLLAETDPNKQKYLKAAAAALGRSADLFAMGKERSFDLTEQNVSARVDELASILNQIATEEQTAGEALAALAKL